MIKAKSERTGKEVEYLNISDPETLLSKAKEAQKWAKEKGFAAKHQNIVNRMAIEIKKLQQLNDEIQLFVTKGKVNPLFDYWAQWAVLPYVRYGLGEKWFYNSKIGGVRKAGDWLKQHARGDYVRVPQTGKNEMIEVTGEHVQKAFYMGSIDILGDSFTQYRSRQNAADPKERIWGDGPYHIDFTHGDGTSGLHFDIIGSNIAAIIGWSLAMPLSFAKMGKNYGSSTTLSYFARMKDGVRRSFSLVNLVRGTAISWLGWFASQEWAFRDYRSKVGDEFDPEAFAKLKKKLKDRLTSAKSVIERKIFNTVVPDAYISPQYYMFQSELQGLLSKVLGQSGRESRLMNIGFALLMSYTTGFYYHVWWKDYFGTDNPDMIKILKKFKADSVLEKIDSNGFTDMRTWTLYETTAISSLITLFEMHKLEQERPFPRGDPEAMAQWYGLLQFRLMRGIPSHLLESEDMSDLMEDISSRLSQVKIRDEKVTKFEYEEEAKTFIAMLEKIESQTRQYLIKKSSRKVFFRPESISSVQVIQQNLKASLDDAVKVQGILSRVLSSMQKNEGILSPSTVPTTPFSWSMLLS